MTESDGLSRRQVKLIVALALITLIVVVALQNWGMSDTKVLFITIKMPLILLIGTSFLIGVIVGWLTRKRRRG